MAETIGLKAVIDVSQFNKGKSDYNKGIGQMNKQTAQATKIMTRSLGKVGPALLSVGGFAGTVAASLVAFGASAIREGRAFDQAMSNVAAISGITNTAVSADFAALEEQAKSLGATTKFTAVEAAEGMTFLAQAGFETTEVLAAMPGTLNLAAASNVGLGQSADIVSNILTGFGATAESTGQFVDVLTNTFTTSNTNLVQLGAAMKNVAPVAASMGFSVEETAAAIAKMSDAGIQGAAAGTQLKNALLNLAAPSAQQAALMKELGIEIFDTNGEMKSLPEIVGEVNEGLSGLGQEQQIAAVKTLAGKRAIAGFQVLLDQGQPALEDYTQSLTKSGTAAQVAATQLDNLEGDITLLNSAFSGFKLAAFELMEPTLRGASKALTELLGTMTEGAAGLKLMNTTMGNLETTGGQVATTMTAFGQATSVASGANVGFIATQSQALSTMTAWGQAAALASGNIQMITEASQNYSLTAEEVATRSEAQARAMSNITQESLGVTKSIEDLVTATSSLILAETDSTQQSVELARNRSFVVTESDKLAMVTAQITRETEAYKQSQVDAAAAEEARQQTTISLLGTMGTFFSGMQSARETDLENEREFNASIGEIRTSAAEAQETARASTNEKMIELEEQRAAEEHRILTGAHDRTTAANDSLLAANNAHFAELTTAESASLVERQAAVEADFAARESQAQEARARELAEQQAHLEELKLNAALATLESTGQLAQFTGGLAISANDAADLIRSGVLPVTEELGAAVQSTLSGLQEKEAEASAQAVSNQALLQQAYAGTLVPLEAQALALGTGIPEAATAAQAATSLVNADIVAGAQNAALATQEQDLTLQNLGTTTFPTLGEAAQTSTQLMNEALATVATPVGELDLALNNIALITLLLLQETFTVMITLMIEQLLMLLNTGILPVDLALIMIHTVTLPTLQQVSQTTAQLMITGFTSVEAVLQTVLAVLDQIVAVLSEVAAAATEATTEMENLADTDLSDLISDLDDAESAADSLTSALRDAASAASGLSSGLASSGLGVGASRGLGLQAGTPSNTGNLLGLGFRIPPGFPNDSFGPLFVESGEEMLVTPRGMTIEGLIFSRLADLLRGPSVQGGSVTNNITNIEMNMNLQTTSSAQANVQQFEIQRGLIGT